MADEEPMHEWARRVYTEAAEEQGLPNNFLIFCITNYPEVLTEFQEYDRQMRTYGVFFAVTDDELDDERRRRYEHDG
mgnify:CR=1 FL=1